jgi:hypothetical protein
MGVVGGATAATLVAPMIMRRANAAFGEFPSNAGLVVLPEGVRAKRVLEIFLYGGLSQWETLYFVRNYGKTNAQQYYTFESSNNTWAGTCGGSNVERAFAQDADGAAVEIGPFAHRLWSRQDVVDRMRLVVQRHNLEPHEAAVPQALTGRPVGQPNGAGLGAHVQRARLELGSDRASPHSYVLATGGISSDNIAAAAAAGAHPGAARPLLIKTDNTERLATLLGRPTVSTSRATHDALVAAYTAQYEKRLEWPGRGRVRAAKVDDFKVAFDTTTRADAIADVLPAFNRAGGSACNIGASEDIPLMALTAAAQLLTHPTEPASYVCVSDIGLYEASGGGGYDTHTYNARDTAMNFDNMMKSLLAIIRAPTDPADARKLSLDDTLIILNTEFGRTPWAQDGGNGRNHHPYGYVTAFIGGPTQKGIAGAIGPDGTATKWTTPAQNRIAALLALGIWPFAHEGFAVSDVKGATSEIDAAVASMQAYLGRTA